MNQVTYYNEFGDEVYVAECSRKEFVELAIETIEGIEDFHDEDSRVYIEYKDGSIFDCMYGFPTQGKFKKNNIAFGCIDDNGHVQEVYGDYKLDENFLVIPATW